MLQKDEEKILSLIRTGPLFIIFISIIVTYYIINNHNNHVKEQVEEAKKESVFDKKALIKREVESVHEFIQNELNQAKLAIEKDIKNRVYEAIAIANSIYKNNRDKDNELIKKLIFDALRDIRFNDSRGYFFIYDMDGKNEMHPILDIEGKNLWDLKDKNGLFVMREFTKIAKEKGEGSLTWWWSKPSDLKNSYEKIGFVKTFEPYNWYIGTGEYVVDYEDALKKVLIEKIHKIRFGKNGYVFVVDKEGVYLSHVKKANIGVNRINLQDKNGVMITKEVIKTAQKGEGYISYVGTIQPTTGLPAEKISFIKGFKRWDWAIGAGVYIDEIDAQIKEKNEIIEKSNVAQFNKVLIISLLIFLFLFIASFYLARVTKKKFLEHSEKTKEKAKELAHLNDTLEEKVLQRTNELDQTIKNLKLTQDKLIEAEKMSSLGVLVAGIAHEVNTPVGIGLTGATHFLEITEDLKKQYDNENMSQEEFEKYLDSSYELATLIDSNLNKAARLVKNFKSISFDQSSEEKRKINLKSYIKEVLFSMHNITKKTNITIENRCDENINIITYPGAISQIITNLVINSIRHGFADKKTGTIIIDASQEEHMIKLVYKDDGKGIDETILPKIFDPFFTTNREKGGTGLGLNIIYNITSNTLHGTVSCKSKKDEGVEFTVLFQENESIKKEEDVII